VLIESQRLPIFRTIVVEMFIRIYWMVRHDSRSGPFLGSDDKITRSKLLGGRIND